MGAWGEGGRDGGGVWMCTYICGSEWLLDDYMQTSTQHRSQPGDIAGDDCDLSGVI